MLSSPAGAVAEAAPFAPSRAIVGQSAPAARNAVADAGVALPPGPLTLTVVLRRSDEDGFTQFLSSVEDPKSTAYRHYLSQSELARRFGPTEATYQDVENWFRGQGFTVTQTSANRMTVTVEASAARIERALGIRLAGYRLGAKTFWANDRNPTVPSRIAGAISDIAGLSNLAQPASPRSADIFEKAKKAVKNPATLIPNQFPQTLADSCWEILQAAIGSLVFGAPELADKQFYQCAADELNLVAAYVGGLGAARTGQAATTGAARLQPRATPIGTGQKIGALEFASFNPSDIRDYLSAYGLPASRLANLTTMPVAGGAGAPGGPGEAEALLDLDTLLTLAPGAKVVAYAGPIGGGGSFQQMFNAMVNDGDTVITNSWTACEDQVSPADVHGIDSILAGAAASGISVLNATGDSGSTCLDGSPATVGVPADSPHATAVGGSSAVPGPGGTYGSETYWDGSSPSAPGGAGGFGVSKVFPRPAYQNGWTGAANRSIPDVVANASPDHGYEICQADSGGCPNGLIYGGTSVSAPIWAAMVADLNQAAGHNLGFLNPLFYPLGHSDAFHSAASMASDFTHVGLGSPNLDLLFLGLTGAAAGPASATTSALRGVPVASVPADGATPDTLVATVADAAGNSLGGKQVTLAAGPGSHAVVNPAPGTTSVNNGAAAFTVVDSVAETVTFTATDTTDGVALAPLTVTFSPPPAAAAGIVASLTTVLADGTTASTITVTLKNAAGQPAIGKAVSLQPSPGAHSAITGPTPALTDSSGQATFSVTDVATETVTYAATDVTDGNLPFPGTATVTFTNSPATTNCFTGTPVAASGNAFTDAITGFPYAGCIGPVGEAFDSSGNLWVLSYTDQVLYRFPSGSGVAGGALAVGSPKPLAGQTGPFAGIAFGKDGQLYAALQGNIGFEGTNGAIVQLSTTTGQVVRTLASYKGFGTTDCATGLATDPLSGDLFFTEPHCAFLGGEPFVNRLANPSSANPVLTNYATPGGVDGIAFGPDGTMYLAGGGGRILSVTGTNGPTPPVVSTIATITTAANGPAPIDGIAVGADPAHPGTTNFLFVNRNDGEIDKVDLTTTPPTVTPVFSGGSRGDFVTVGANGCLYATQTDRIVEITAADGTCSLAPPAVVPQLALIPGSVSPNPVQGGEVTLTAQLVNVAAPGGVPVRFWVNGANTELRQVVTDASGQARLTYPGVTAGLDLVTAKAVVGSTTLTSNQTPLTWAPGVHSTTVDLNVSPTGGAVGATTHLRAVLEDLSADPIAPLAGRAVTLSAGAASCSALTDGAGRAECPVTVVGPPGLATLTGTFAGDAGFKASSSTGLFQVVVAPALVPPVFTADTPPPSATVGAAYSYTFAASGKPAPTFSVSSGKLPAGLTLDTASGVLSGTPTTIGVSGFTVTAANGTSPDAVTPLLTITVTGAKTTTTVSANPSNPGLGTPVTFVAIVAPTAPNVSAPTGTVSFFVDGQSTAVATVALVGGRAAFTTSALGAGSHSVLAVYNGDATFAPSTSATATTATVACTNEVTGNHPGALIVRSGSLCIIGAHVGGSVIVAKGASIDVEGSTIGGSISADGGAGSVRICATTTTGAVSVQQMAGLVIVGDPGDAACQPNRIGGSLILQNNAGGVEALNNTVAGLVAANNSGPGPYPGDPTTISGNHQ